VAVCQKHLKYIIEMQEKQLVRIPPLPLNDINATNNPYSWHFCFKHYRIRAGRGFNP